jgi:methylthioribulose-1-phosphate dehydratase
LNKRRLVPATSGNLSARLSEQEFLITASGIHKGKLRETDFLRVDVNGSTLDNEQRKPSAETLLHVQLYRHYPEINIVLHPHSVNSTVLSRRLSGHLQLGEYEILKAFPGIDTHDTSVTIPVFENLQDILRLAKNIEPFLSASKPVPAYLIRGHGYYTWGVDLADALKHIEALEFLFECELTQGVQ